MDSVVTIESARTEDATDISAVLAANRGDSGLFQESAVEITRTLGDFLVARNERGTTVGCAGMHQDSPELAEIYAVAVVPECQGHGAGQRLVGACFERARSVGVKYLWLATVKPEYFRRYGFQPISRWSLPTSVLLRKLRQTFKQPYRRWLPALCGRHTFMRTSV